MSILIYLSIAAVLFIIGTVFILKSLPYEEEKAVPIENPRELRELRAVYENPEKKKPGFSLKLDIDKEEPADDNQFMETSHQLRKDLLEQEKKYEELKRQMEALKAEHDLASQRKDATIKMLEDENEQFKHGQRQIVHSAEEELKSQIEQLQKQYSESQQQQKDTRDLLDQMRIEKDELANRMNVQGEQIVERLREKNEKDNRAEFEVLSNKLVEAIAAIEELKRENKDLQKVNLEMKEEFEKIGAMNEQLMKKEKMMQYELTKNRAQALGLEKICADFRSQIETMAGAAPLDA